MLYVKYNNIVGVILAGGKSTRMGVDKAKVILQSKTLLQHMVVILEGLGLSQIFISSNDDKYNNIPDIMKNLGPMGGIYSILTHFRNIRTSFLFVSVDMPLLDTQVLRVLCDNCFKHDSICYKSTPLPLLLMNTNMIFNKVKKYVSNNNGGSIYGFLELLNHRNIIIEEKSHYKYLNINEPDDLRKCIIK